MRWEKVMVKKANEICTMKKKSRKTEKHASTFFLFDILINISVAPALCSVRSELLPLISGSKEID